MSKDRRFELVMTEGQYGSLAARAGAANVSIAEYLRIRAGIVTGRAADSVATTCNDPEHLRALALANSIGAALATYRAAIAARDAGKPAAVQPDGGMPGLSTSGPDRMKGEDATGKNLPGGRGIGDAAAALDLKDLLPPAAPMKGGTLADLADAIRRPRKGRA